MRFSWRRSTIWKRCCLHFSVVRGLSSDLPVIAQFAVEDVGRTQDGYTVQEAFDQAVQSGADVVGFNCRSGPYGIMRAMDKLRDGQPVPMSGVPERGDPRSRRRPGGIHRDGRITSLNAPLKFAERGMRIIGGCCGTTPEHIAAMAQALQGRDLKSLAEQGVRASEPGASGAGGVSGADETKAETAVLDRPSRGRVTVGEEPKAAPASGAAAEAVSQPPREPSIVELVRQRHTVIVELDPPRDLDIDGSCAARRRCRKRGRMRSPWRTTRWPSPA